MAKGRAHKGSASKWCRYMLSRRCVYDVCHFCHLEDWFAGNQHAEHVPNVMQKDTNTLRTLLVSAARRMPEAECAVLADRVSALGIPAATQADLARLLSMLVEDMHYDAHGFKAQPKEAFRLLVHGVSRYVETSAPQGCGGGGDGKGGSGGGAGAAAAGCARPPLLRRRFLPPGLTPIGLLQRVPSQPSSPLLRDEIEAVASAGATPLTPRSDDGWNVDSDGEAAGSAGGGGTGGAAGGGGGGTGVSASASSLTRCSTGADGVYRFNAAAAVAAEGGEEEEEQEADARAALAPQQQQQQVAAAAAAAATPPNAQQQQQERRKGGKRHAAAVAAAAALLLSSSSSSSIGSLTASSLCLDDVPVWRERDASTEFITSYYQ